VGTVLVFSAAATFHPATAVIAKPNAPRRITLRILVDASDR
jgi:hypothetical protein